jgi:thiosulfate/3-mercaptopyruvate sulfurtransferase
MNRTRISVIVLFVCVVFLPLVSSARDVEPIVNTTWLEQNLNNPQVIIVDIRKVWDHRAGHIPNVISVFYGSWAIQNEVLRNELPANDDLFDAIGWAGIGSDSIVVLVGKADAPDDITRVAWTLKYAGILNVAILDGGFNKWIADKKNVSTDPVRPRSKPYRGKVNEDLFVTKDYVMKAVGKATIVDVREPDYFNGVKKLDFVAKAGHMPKAVNLPTSHAYKQDGIFKDKAELMNIASAVVGKDTTREIITYCDTGKASTAWAFLLTELLGYKNVKVYDGSAEEWTKDPLARWEQ